MKKVLIVLALLALVTLAPSLAAAGQLEGDRVVDYRDFDFLGLDNRTVVWIVAELHLMFAAFVLAVPIFALIVEIIGLVTKDERYDRLAKEFTKLLSAAFATTAALGGLLTFLLFGLYPGAMRHLTGVFHNTMYLYAFLFFGEAFSLYSYYYSWERLKNTKWLHITLGVLLNLFGTTLMFIANSWATYMMIPPGVGPQGDRLSTHWDAVGSYIGPLGDAVANALWMPINVHRLIANVCFGGFIVGAYAAIKFLTSRSDEERAHYDWMGYVGNFIGIAALIPLPFAGYWLGREIYSASPVMGNISMGGSFSWAFVIQAILIGVLFLGGNYYLWMGMERIKGSERYTKYLKYLNVLLIIGFAIWLTPHNLPLSGEETAQIGEQYHPFSKFFGVMVAKNAAVQLIILVTLISFLLYRRSNVGATLPFKQQGKGAKICLGMVGLLCLATLGWYVLSLAGEELNPAEKGYVTHLIALLVGQMIGIVLSLGLAFANRGKLAQLLLFAITFFSAVIYLSVVIGYEIMEKANLALRYVSVAQVLIVLSCLISVVFIDIFLFRKAKTFGPPTWGKMPVRSQYVLLLLCTTIVLLMGLMGFVRSGLREEWHVYGILRDTSATAFTPSYTYMARVVAIIVTLFLGLVSFVFWLAGLAEKKAP